MRGEAAIVRKLDPAVKVHRRCRNKNTIWENVGLKANLNLIASCVPANISFWVELSCLKQLAWSAWTKQVVFWSKESNTSLCEGPLGPDWSWVVTSVHSDFITSIQKQKRERHACQKEKKINPSISFQRCRNREKQASGDGLE